MTLRNHPLMTYRSIPNWPPVWTRAQGSDVVRGEVGVLKRIAFNSKVIANRCFLLIEHEGESLMGTLIFDDAKFCQQIADLLQTQLGRTIKEIGDLDLSHTF